jgi:hypothetical protein
MVKYVWNELSYNIMEITSVHFLGTWKMKGFRIIN